MGNVWSHGFYKKWMKVTAVVVGVAAPILFLGQFKETSSLATITLDVLSGKWGHNGLDNNSSRLLSAILGGITLGWAVNIWSLSGEAYDAHPDAVRRTVLNGLCAWFALDSAGSIASGNPLNAAWNVGVLALAAGPLWWSLPPKTKSKD